jgi:hypothetical protein
MRRFEPGILCSGDGRNDHYAMPPGQSSYFSEWAIQKESRFPCEAQMWLQWPSRPTLYESWEEQCDQTGRKFAIWAIFLATGALSCFKNSPNDLSAIFCQKNRTKLNLIRNKFGPFCQNSRTIFHRIDLKFVFILIGRDFGRLLASIGRLFCQKRLVALDRSSKTKQAPFWYDSKVIGLPTWP